MRGAIESQNAPHCGPAVRCRSIRTQDNEVGLGSDLFGEVLQQSRFSYTCITSDFYESSAIEGPVNRHNLLEAIYPDAADAIFDVGKSVTRGFRERCTCRPEVRSGAYAEMA